MTVRWAPTSRFATMIWAAWFLVVLPSPCAVAQSGFSADLVTNSSSTSFYYWIPRARDSADFGALAPVGATTSTWPDRALRQVGAMVGWDATEDVASGKALNLGVFTGGAKTGATAYANFIPHDGGGVPGAVFEVKATLRSTAATAAGCPGYRVGFLNGGQTHAGMLQVYNDTANQPWDGSPFVARCYWTTPSGLTEMGDGGRIATFGVTPPVAIDPDATDPVMLGADGRDYGLEIMCIDRPDSTGEFAVDALSVRTLSDASLTVGASKEWKQSDASLSASTWGVGFFDIPGLVRGTGKFENNALLMWGARDVRHIIIDGPQADGFFRIVKASPLAREENAVRATAQTLYRTRLTARSYGPYEEATTVASPVMLLHHMLLTSDFGLGHAGAIGWYESWGPIGTCVKDPLRHTAGQGSPGVPPTTPATVKSYVWTHECPSDSQILVPEIYVYNTGIYFGTPWGEANGFLKFTKIQMEEITGGVGGE